MTIVPAFSEKLLFGHSSLAISPVTIIVLENIPKANTMPFQDENLMRHVIVYKCKNVD